LNKTKTKNLYLENALKYKEKFGLDFIPLQISKGGKRPLVHSWKELQENEQTDEDLKKYEWDKANGLGMINKTITTLDFDKCEDEKFIRIIIDELDGNYWLVKTGFGFHLHFILDEPEFLENILGVKGVYTFEPKDTSTLKQVELRVKSCYTAFPRSKHFNGSYYEFIDREPESLPDIIDSKKLIEIINKYFILTVNDSKVDDTKNLTNDLEKIYANGTDEGNRHNSLISLFGALHRRDVNGQFLKTTLLNWNKKNRPPLDDREINKTINNLIRQYDKGLDGIFLEFNGCLLQLQDDDELKLKKIICFAVVEYGSDKKIIEELELGDKLTEYHKECKRLVEHYEEWTGKKDQIVRVGKALLLDSLNGKFRFDYFCIYVGIVSYLGRNPYKPAKQIAHNVIRFRAMGFKDETEYIKSASKAVPIKESIIRSGIKNIEDRNLLRSFSLVKGRMKWFSTFFKTNEKLAEWVRDREIEKNRKKNEQELLRIKIQEEIQRELDELNKRTKRTKTNNPSLSSSLHLLSDGS